MPFACKFCIAMYGLKGTEVSSLPADKEAALTHVETVHGYPSRSARDILGAGRARELAADTIELTGAVVMVTTFKEDPPQS